MAVKIRMKRFGRTNRAFFRINAVDSRAARDGRVIEELGSYDPHAPDDRKVRLNAERVLYWLSVGAQPSDTVRTFLERAGLMGNKKVTRPIGPVTAESVARAAPAVETAAAPAAEARPAADAAPSATETSGGTAPAAPGLTEPEPPAPGGVEPAEPESAAP